jgi:hypothetical protein
MVVAESIKSQVLHLATRQRNVPFCDDESCDGELRARVSWIFLLFETRLSGYWRKWKMFRGRFSKYGNSSK